MGVAFPEQTATRRTRMGLTSPELTAMRRVHSLSSCFFIVLSSSASTPLCSHLEPATLLRSHLRLCVLCG
jgi:hypothetical protein